jgi:hypothetical protein
MKKDKAKKTVVIYQAKNGAIDEIGGVPEAKKYLEQTVGQKLDICW